MIGRRRRTDAILVLTIFVVAFVPRAVYPVSRPSQWYKRSVRFIYDIQRGAWERTYHSAHPAVTTMWLSGIALHLAGVGAEYRPDGEYVDPRPLTARESAIGVLPLAIAIAAGICLTYGLLLRLFSRLAAYGAAVLVALDPFYLASSKVLHVDGLLATLVTVSALSLLVYLRRRQIRWIALSGGLAGLALLTKGPAIFLVPYAALCLGLGVMCGRQISWRRAIGSGALWLAVACLVYVALFPAMWVDPLGTLRTIYAAAVVQAVQAHPEPLYFLGHATDANPGAAYYPVVWACELTALASVLAPVGVLAGVICPQRRRGERATIALLVALALFFTLQMTLASKKMPRYLLPAFPAVDILAGVGLAWWARRTSSFFSKAPIAAAFPVALVLLIQGVVTLARHPYYGTYFNGLVGTRAGIWALSTQWQGEGLDIAARAMDSDPGSRGQVVASDIKSFFRQYYSGRVRDVLEPADWYVFAINNTMRREGTDEGAPWEYYRRRQPEQTVSFGQATYVWVYRAADGPQNTLEVTFGPSIRLVGYDIAPPPYESGDSVRLQLYWQTAETLDQEYTIFVHLLDMEGDLVSQVNAQPVRAMRPTTTWEPGETIIDPYDLDVPADFPPGEVTVALGMYRWPSAVRVAAYSPEGDRLPDNLVVLRSLSVTRRSPEPRVWVARVLGAALLVTAIVVPGRRRG